MRHASRSRGRAPGAPESRRLWIEARTRSALCTRSPAESTAQRSNTRCGRSGRLEVRGRAAPRRSKSLPPPLPPPPFSYSASVIQRIQFLPLSSRSSWAILCITGAPFARAVRLMRRARSGGGTDPQTRPPSATSWRIPCLLRRMFQANAVSPRTLLSSFAVQAHVRLPFATRSSRLRGGISN